MTRVISRDLRVPLLHILCALMTVFLLVALAQPARSASMMQEDTPIGEGKVPVEGDSRQDRVVVVPEPPHWNGWGEWEPGAHRSAPRVKVWVDRGDWSTYHPGDRLWVYFRVDRPCYVTILDYAPNGRVDTIFPSRWSGSSFVSPGVTYMIPESRRYSLRIAGPGGIETLVACAHETPWPSGPGGVWIPRHRPDRGRVVVGRPGGSPPPGWRGHVRISPGDWPVPPAWRERPELWSCDSVSFYVETSEYWNGAPWDGGRFDQGLQGGSWGQCPYGGSADWGYDSSRDAHRVLYDRYRMTNCEDRLYRDVYIAGERAVLSIECVESAGGRPTEIVGRMIGEGRPGDDLVFRLDVEGKHGERPLEGQVFYSEYGRLVAEVRVLGFTIQEKKAGREPRLDSIDFEVRVYAR
ncbi:MAG: DUF4384 domain-containing protein [Candidatus Eisenbacteria bacterium]|nr:DUF4384 domain-containing protein [Candidatus Eisenbacteria bacterium]